MTRWEAETLLSRYERSNANELFMSMPYGEPVPYRYQEAGIAASPSDQVRTEPSDDVTGHRHQPMNFAN